MVWGGLDAVCGGGLRWFGANMAGQRNKNACKFLLLLLILSRKHIRGVKKVVWDGLEVVWRCFGVFGVASFHKKIPFEVNLPFIGE